MVGIVGLYILTPRINLFTIVISMIFAGLLLVPASFIRQSRFHYRYLLLNESASRFIAVLGSFLLGALSLGRSSCKPRLLFLCANPSRFLLLARAFRRSELRLLLFGLAPPLSFLFGA